MWEVVGVSQPLKSPGVAGVLSFFIAGLGQIYNGQVGKGIGWFLFNGVVAIFAGRILFDPYASDRAAMFFLFLVFALFVSEIWCIVDAVRSGRRFNDAIEEQKMVERARRQAEQRRHEEALLAAIKGERGEG